MLQITKLCLATSSGITGIGQRHVATTAARAIDQKWRADKGLPENPNAFGPLTNLPDYTFLDGRPTPLGSNQKKRLLKQQEIATKIVELSGELEFAKQRYERNKVAAATEKQRIIENKLKPKGHLMLQQKK
ncbi:39S ribosomal protein L52, mitochondrial isoform X1 [Drosophila guanche]|uniref:Large ribosomal subunit protein mL52 n=1 Tax=Drosophila guanche TaxID=7266 RepID=A0A3B0JE72_DROGU|nr:39S ribosomal protein L52, mitochondrial isoform X1 [Drosophila guanche]SPP73570.1 blast:39S ribosomal protein L52%2C mitochondrial [Drosophila guanche]